MLPKSYAPVLFLRALAGIVCDKSLARLRRSEASGFTLLEVMVALVIAVLALAALFNGIAGGLHAVQMADLSEQALSRARSHLESLRGAMLAPGVQSGQDGGGFSWETQVTSVAFAATAAANPSLAARMGLYNVAVIISWQTNGKTQHVRLDSQRLGVLPP